MHLLAVFFFIASLAAANAVPVTKTTYTNYIVSTFTGDIPDADSDSDVYITLFGTDGLSCYAHLENDHNNFETGLIDTFSILCPYLGPLQFAFIDKNDSGSGPKWFLDEVSVYDKIDWKVYNFPFNGWVDDVGIFIPVDAQSSN